MNSSKNCMWFLLRAKSDIRECPATYMARPWGFFSRNRPQECRTPRRRERISPTERNPSARIVSRPFGIVREGLSHLPARSEVQDLGRQPSVASVVDGDAVHAGQGSEQLEPEARDGLQRLSPIRAYCFLAAQPSGRLSDQGGDDRRGHFKVVVVMREDAIEIIGVPCRDPLLSKTVGKAFLHQALFRVPIAIISAAVPAPHGGPWRGQQA